MFMEIIVIFFFFAIDDRQNLTEQQQRHDVDIFSTWIFICCFDIHEL